jgi:hypothetical protein
MKQLMVLSHDTYASGLTPASSDLDNLSSLAAGAWALIDKNTESATYDQVVDIAATSEADTPVRFQIVTMTANGLKFSPIIEKANATCTYTAYNAPVAKVMNISVTLTGLAAGQVAGFTVTDNTKPAHNLSRVRPYVYTVGTADTEAVIVAALIALVNADTLRVVTASAGTDIVLTGDTAGANFTVAPIGIFSSATITITTPLEVGTGTAAQLALYEKECQIERGSGNYPQYQQYLYTEVSEVNTTTPGTYDTWLIRYTVPSIRPVIIQENVAQELLIATLVSLSDSGDGKTCEGLTNLNADLAV